MIKFFKSDYSYNWVSDDGQFIGFSRDQQCCEYFGYFYVYEIFEDEKKIFEDSNKNNRLRQTIHSGALDKNNNYYFGELTYKSLLEHRDNDLPDDEDNIVYVSIYDSRRKHDRNLEGYLVLYNTHNGYYWHGLDFVLDAEITHYNL